MTLTCLVRPQVSEEAAFRMKPTMINRMCWTMTLLLVATGCDARQRMWKGEVRQSGGLPCFGMPKIRDAKPAEVAAVTVSEIDEREAVLQTAWNADYTRSTPSVVMSPANCIIYGFSGNSSRIIGPVLPMQPGKRYAVSINSNVRRGGGWENRRYEAYFCLSPGVPSMAVHDVKWDQRAGKRNWAVCGIGLLSHDPNSVKKLP